MRKKAWGADHMMRSGKRHDDDWYPGVVVDHGDDWYPGVVVDQEGPDNHNRVRRSGISRNSWGGVHMLRTGKRSGQRQDWGQDFLRSLRNRTGLDRRGSYFGGGHMMRSGK